MISLVDGIQIFGRIPVTRGSKGNTILTTPKLFDFFLVKKTHCINSHGNGENGPLQLIADFSLLIDGTDCLTKGSESQTLYLELGHEEISYQ